MTPTETLAAAKLMAQWAQSVIDGKPIELQAKERCNPASSFLAVSSPIWDFDCMSYRRKPQPKRVPLEAKDVPPGSVIRNVGDHRPLMMQVICIWSEGIRFFDGHCELPISRTWDRLFQGYEISRDNGKTWEPCSKEVSE